MAIELLLAYVAMQSPAPGFRVLRVGVKRRNPTQRNAARRLFAERVTGELERSDFARNGWASALNAAAIFAFWEEMEPGLFEG